jgi:hypothetical protein
MAASRFVRDRDFAQLQATMARLDAEEKHAHSGGTVEVTPGVALHYLANPSERWDETEPEGRRTIAKATFDRIEALGLDIVMHPSAEAKGYGWSDAFGSRPLVCSISRSGRGERHSPATNDLPITMRLAEPPEPCDWLQSA